MMTCCAVTVLVLLSIQDQTLERSVFMGSPWNRNLGDTVAVGDVNGDGLADVVATAPYADAPGRPWAGAVYVIFGASDLSERLSRPRSWAENSLRILGALDYGSLGTGLAVGDFNGDGLADVAASSCYEGHAWKGRIHVIWGQRGMSPGDWDLARKPADVVIAGAFRGMRLGLELGAGDFDGDGLKDLVASAPGYVIQSGKPGTVMAFLGSNLRMRDQWDTEIEPADAVFFGLGQAEIEVLTAANMRQESKDTLIIALPTAEVNGHRGWGVVYGVEYSPLGPVVDVSASSGVWKMCGASGAEGLGASVTPVDLDQDGLDELVLGASRANDPDAMSGAVFLVDPLDAYRSPFRVWTGPGFSVAGSSVAVGDVDQNGSFELAIGAPEDDDKYPNCAWFRSRSDVGKVYVIHDMGAFVEDGCKPSPDYPVQEVLSGPDKYSWLGHSVVMADVNGDRRDDVIAGAPRSDPEGRQDAGSLFFLLTQHSE